MNIMNKPSAYLIGLLLLLSACKTTEGELVGQGPMGFGSVFLERITDDKEVETWLRVSPNGKYLIFNLLIDKGSVAPSAFKDIFRRSSQQPEYRKSKDNIIAYIEIGKPGKRIVSQPGMYDASWYPDGGSFVYSVPQGSEKMLAKTIIGEGISAVKFLYPTPCGKWDSEPSISGDGKLVVFHTNSPSGIAIGKAYTSTERCTLLFEGIEPQWHPRARRFVFSKVIGGYFQLYIYDEPTSQLSQFTFGNYNNRHPSWSPDGEKITYVSDRNGNADVYVINANGTGLIQVTTGPAQEMYPTWSPDGYIYFSSNTGNQVDIWRARLAGR